MAGTDADARHQRRRDGSQSPASDDGGDDDGERSLKKKSSGSASRAALDKDKDVRRSKHAAHSDDDDDNGDNIDDDDDDEDDEDDDEDEDDIRHMTEEDRRFIVDDDDVEESGDDDDVGGKSSSADRRQRHRHSHRRNKHSRRQSASGSDPDEDEDDEGDSDGRDRRERSKDSHRHRSSKDGDRRGRSRGDDEDRDSDSSQNKHGDDDQDDDDADDGGDREHRRHKKKRRRRDRVDDDDALSDDELELIQENIGASSGGIGGFKRLRKKGYDQRDSVARMFDEDDDLGAEDGEIANEQGAAAGGARRRQPGTDRSGFNPAELYESDDDDINDFVVSGDMDDTQQRESREKRKAQRIKQRAAVRDIGKGLDIPAEAWDKIMDLFGDGEDYYYALYDDNEEPEEHPEGGAGDQDGADNDDQMLESRQRPKPLRLNDVYEPAEIAEKMLTEEDERIRVRDVPERFQLAEQTMVPTDEELTREANFISRQLYKDAPEEMNEAQFLSAVGHILRFLRKDMLEVPFIFAHRKDYFDGRLKLEMLWRIMDLNTAFLNLEAKKRALSGIVHDLCASSTLAAKDEGLTKMVESLGTIDDVDEIHHYIQVMYGREMDRIHQATQTRRRTFKRPLWRREYEDALNKGLDQLANLFNIEVSAYAVSITQQQLFHIPEDHPKLPQDAALEWISDRYKNAQQALEAARLIISHRIAAQPSLRAFLRRVYENDSVVDVVLTDKGRKTIEPSHPYYPFKYIRHKPTNKFTDGQFLQILAAETEGLLTITIRVEEEKRLISDMSRFIRNDYVNELAEEWNKQRHQIAEYVAREILFPYCVKWTREKLATRASEWVSEKCRLALEDKINMAPFKWVKSIHESNGGDGFGNGFGNTYGNSNAANGNGNDDDKEDDEEAGGSPVVVSISWGLGERGAPTFATALDKNGEMIEYIKLDRLMDRERTEDVRRLAAFIGQHHPAVVAVGGQSSNTQTLLMRILEEVVTDAHLDHKMTRKAVLTLVEDQVARIYMYSKQAERDFPEKDYPQLVRYCVALGRKTQEPLHAYARLCNSAGDIRNVHLHPLQNLLPEERFKNAVERAFINIVNSVGVDINWAVGHPHLSGTLQFVSGLGPRKAQAMLSRIVRRGGRLESRADIAADKYAGAVVFINCASFIRIRKWHFETNEASIELDVLDDMRIHPEDYTLARKMAADTLDLDDAAIDADAPSAPIQQLREEDPTRLNVLMLDDYAMLLEREFNQPKRICLEEIKEEIMHPYRDHRKPFVGATPDEAFTMLTGESDETVHDGLITTGEIVRNKDRFLVCRLPSGLEGVLHSRNLDGRSDPSINLTAVYKEGASLPVRIIGVNKERLSVELAGRANDVDPQNAPPPKRDPFFNQAQENDDLATERSLARVVRQQRGVRMIQHPFFRNVDYKAAEAYLATRPRGEVVVRPSTRGNDHISITWKVDEGVYQHIDVLELDKENEWSLGRTLRIDRQTFMELDQIIADYVEPMNRRITQLMHHAKYQNKHLDDMMQFVRDQATTIKRSAYGFILVSNKPGAFYLVFKHPTNRVRHEVVVVRPQGFEFRNKMFPTVDAMLAFFKQDEAERAKREAKNAAAAAAAAASASAAAASSNPMPRGGGGMMPPSMPYGQPKLPPMQPQYGMPPIPVGGPMGAMAGMPPMGMGLPQQPPPMSGLSVHPSRMGQVSSGPYRQPGGGMGPPPMMPPMHGGGGPPPPPMYPPRGMPHGMMHGQPPPPPGMHGPPPPQQSYPPRGYPIGPPPSHPRQPQYRQ